MTTKAPFIMTTTFPKFGEIRLTSVQASMRPCHVARTSGNEIAPGLRYHVSSYLTFIILITVQQPDVLITSGVARVQRLGAQLPKDLARFPFLPSSIVIAHCLNHLYTVKPRPTGAMRLRTRGHQFELPAIKYKFNKRNFIVRSLFNYV